MKDLNKKDEPVSKKPVPESAPESAKTSGSLSSDFKNATKLIQHIKKLDNAGKEAFADKYGIQYKNISEISSAARTKFWG